MDYTSVRALILAQAGKPSPDGVIIQIPPLNEIKIAKVTEMMRWAHGVDVNPYGGSSDGNSAPPSQRGSPRPSIDPIVNSVRAAWQADPSYGGTRVASPRANDVLPVIDDDLAALVAAHVAGAAAGGSLVAPLCISDDDYSNPQEPLPVLSPAACVSQPLDPHAAGVGSAPCVDTVHAPVHASPGPLPVGPIPQLRLAPLPATPLVAKFRVLTLLRKFSRI